MSRIYIYDTTLRDGSQMGEISFTISDKHRIASLLDDFNIDFIEGGMPAFNPKDMEFMSSDLGLSHAKMVSFGRTRKPDVNACDDEELVTLAECPTEWVAIFGKTWDLHVTDVLRTDLKENLRMIKDSIEFLKSKGKKVIFDAEHFFDGFNSNRTYAMRAVKTAIEGGADWIVLCDTNGGSLPELVGKATSKIVKIFDKVGIHTHNDSELAVASSVAAVSNGATMVQGCINGYGERCGNANLCSLIPILKIKMGHTVSADLKKLNSLSHTVSEIANINHSSNMPFVGDMAFAHKGGMHVNAIMKDSRTYEHISPESVGNRRRVLISDMSGRSSISMKLKEFGMSASDLELSDISEHVKQMEADDYQYEGADASLQLLAMRLSGKYSKPFEIKSCRLHMSGAESPDMVSEANLKVVNIDGQTELTAAESDGPVNAMDLSLRKAISKFYPEINKTWLSDYKVRVLDGDRGTEARVRVLITTTDGTRDWKTVGVSTNIITASLIALSDSHEYAIMTNRSGEQ